MISLHIGGASTASVLVTLTVIFFLVFVVSFAFGDVPAGGRRFSREWISRWVRASAPRLVTAGLFAAVLFATSSMFGRGADTGAGDTRCGEGVPSLSGKDVTDARIMGAVEGMNRIADAAAEGDVGQAQTLFLTGDAHALTHDVDALLRSVDAELARDLCLRVVVLENQMAGILDAAVIEREARAVSELLSAARTAIANVPSAPTGAASDDPCANPIGPVTDRPLTQERLNDVIASYMDIAAMAETAGEADLIAIFAGDAHSLTHDIDSQLRKADQALAVELCQSLVAMEREFGSGFSRAVIAEKAATAATLIGEAGEAMGILE